MYAQKKRKQQASYKVENELRSANRDEEKNMLSFWLICLK